MGKLRIFTVATLAGLCGLIFFTRLHTYDEPLERDITTYAVIGHELLAGKSLYSDLWDHKPPAVHVTFAAAELMTGYGRDSIFLMNVVAAVATLLACYFAGAAAGGGRLAGFTAATLWAIASGDVALQANQPNTEVFLNALLTVSFAVFVRAENRDFRIREVLVLGSLLAFASLYKTVVIAQAALLGAAHCIWPPAGSRKKALTHIGLIAGIGASFWALVISYFSLTGRSEQFRATVFTYNRFYAGDIWLNLRQFFAWPNLDPDVLTVLLAMGALVFVGMILGMIVGPRRPWVLLIAWCVATHLSVLLPGQFFPHYYQLWLPPLVIGAGWTISLLKRTLPGRLSALSYGVATVICAVLAFIEFPYWSVPSESWSLAKYGPVFLETDRLAHQINHLILPSETFYEWGNETGLYFESQRRPPSGITFAYPTLAGPLAVKLSRRLIDDLDESKPDLIVVEKGTARRTTEHPVMKWIVTNYRPFSEATMFVLYARKGSALDQRQHAVVAN